MTTTLDTVTKTFINGLVTENETFQNEEVTIIMQNKDIIEFADYAERGTKIFFSVDLEELSKVSYQEKTLKEHIVEKYHKYVCENCHRIGLNTLISSYRDLEDGDMIHNMKVVNCFDCHSLSDEVWNKVGVAKTSEQKLNILLDVFEKNNR